MARKILVKLGQVLCACAAVIAPVVVEGCRIRYYQPEEPAGLKEFASRKKD